MRTNPAIWAVFLLALTASVVAAQQFIPISSRLRLPSTLEGKPVWALSELSNGTIAVGYEGGFAIGTHDGAWKTYVSPNGQVVKVVSESDTGLLVAGEGFCGYLDRDALIIDPTMSGDYLAAVPLSDGWLVAARSEVFRIHRSPDSLWRAERTSFSGDVRLAKYQGHIIASRRGGPVNVWNGSDFEPFVPLAGIEDSLVLWSDHDLLVTDKGILTANGELALDGTANRRELRSGIVGVAADGPWVIVATFADGISFYERSTGKLLRKWKEPLGNIYWFSRTKTGHLIGSSTGAFSISSPYKAEVAEIANEPIFDLIAGGNSKISAVTASGSLAVTDLELQKTNSQWPTSKPAVAVSNSVLELAGQRYPLPTRFIYGLSHTEETVGVVTETDLKIYGTNSSPITIPLDGAIRGLASDGRNYFISSTTQGVHVVTPQGRIQGRIGAGRAAVSEFRSGKTVLTFWDGALLDSDANLIGRVKAGNPRDATYIDGRLVVLATRADRGPVVGFVEGESWQPLEIPGLSEVAAEQIAANEEYLFAAGPRGVIRVRLPLSPSVDPSPKWRFSGRREGSRVDLRSSSEEFLEISAILEELPPAPTTRFEIRVGNSNSYEIQPGRPMQIPVAWGRTEIVTLAERNGLVAEETFTVVRPWPWWLRPWAWPLHLAASAGAVLGLSRLRTRRLEQRNRELEARVANRTAELRKANAAKEEFLAGISHEIRNPLNGVVGICAMLADREVGPREKMLVRTLGGCADQLRSMLDDILDFSRIERGDVSVTNQDFELGSLVEESAMIMDPERSACTLIIPDEPVWLHGDSGKLRQIACNLISNALKYGVPREAGVEVRVENAGGGRSRLRIAVRNSGPTIPSEELPRLFNSFQRGSRTAGMGGSGLGLAVCRRLIQAMGGRITAASLDGVTEFAIEVLLPNARPPERNSELPTIVSRALAIEDEDYNRIALGHVLRALGYQVDWAADGAAALKLAGERQYDLILTDWRLPDMNGGDLCRRILSLLPNPKPPVVAVTAYSTTEKLDEARAAGMTGFVTKPVTQEKLSRVIRGLSEGLQPRRSLDINLAPPPASPLASLGDLAPSCDQLARDIAARWRNTSTMAELRDPRTAREAHALRSLLLLAAEETTAEQIALLEAAAERSDWMTVDKLLPFAAEEILQTHQRLSA